MSDSRLREARLAHSGSKARRSTRERHRDSLLSLGHQSPASISLAGEEDKKSRVRSLRSDGHPEDRCSRTDSRAAAAHPPRMSTRGQRSRQSLSTASSRPGLESMQRIAAASSAFARATTTAHAPSSTEWISEGTPRRRSSRSATTRTSFSCSRATPGPTAGRSSARASSSSTTVASVTKPPPSNPHGKPPPASAVSSSSVGGSSSRKRAAPATASFIGTAPESSSPAPAANKRSRSSLKPPPNAKNDADYYDQKPSAVEAAVGSEVHCCICMSEPETIELATINGCDHQFCFGCIAKWSDRENTCPLCKVRFTKICRVHPHRTSRGGSGSGSCSKGRKPNTKTVKQRDQRSDFLSASTLEGLLQSLAASASGPPPHAFMNPLVRHLLGANFGANSNDSAGFVLGMDSDDDDDDDDDGDMFHPFSFFMQASSSQFRMAPFSSFPAMAVLPMPSTAPGAATSSSSTSRVQFMASSHVPRNQPISAAASSSAYASAASSGGPRSLLFAVAAAASSSRPSRSYATNAGDVNAGSDPTNPLEIDDSSDDEVQVVSVNRWSAP